MQCSQQSTVMHGSGALGHSNTCDPLATSLHQASVHLLSFSPCCQIQAGVSHHAFFNQLYIIFTLSNPGQRAKPRIYYRPGFVTSNCLSSSSCKFQANVLHQACVQSTVVSRLAVFQPHLAKPKPTCYTMPTCTTHCPPPPHPAGSTQTLLNRDQLCKPAPSLLCFNLQLTNLQLFKICSQPHPALQDSCLQLYAPISIIKLQSMPSSHFTRIRTTFPPCVRYGIRLKLEMAYIGHLAGCKRII
jgi:hypothetical protein